MFESQRKKDQILITAEFIAMALLNSLVALVLAIALIIPKASKFKKFHKHNNISSNTIVSV